MDVATALTVAQTLFATLQCAEVRKLCSIFEYEFELKKLLDTVEIIKKCLLDADSKCQELTHEGQYWVQNLKDAVYDADDLLDEFNAVAHQLKGMPGGKIFKKVRRFFSSNNQLIFAFDKSTEIKKLNEKLDSLAKNRRNFGFSELYKPVKIREETCSYVYEHDIIGRDADKEAIVDLLLKDDSEINSFVTIVGIGGLGKTALAQLVFNDDRIKETFKDEMYWVCVSLNFDTKDILGMMLGMNELGFEDLHKKVRNKIEGKRFLLVLDDVWYENSRKWDELKNFLILGGRGSRILVTSRSKKVARAIGNYQIYELQGLSTEDSWELFKKISLGQGEDETVTDLVQIGKGIVRKCANVPLSIRVVASLLRGQDITVWQSYIRLDLAKMRDDEDELMQTLMFSYYHLDHELKTCFSFCSVFPQDYVIYREDLISLWSAHGYLVPSGTDNRMEDIGERYFSILLHRCFFQDVKQNGSDGVESVKMHDLIHDLVRKISGKESLTLTACSTPEGVGKIRNLFIDDSNNEHLTSWLCSSNNTSNTLRTCLKNFYIEMSDVNAIISKCTCLRVLDLRHSLTNRTLPDTLGRLLHLRYLDLSYNEDLEMLPKSITKLHNLQTLKLYNCKNLKELPEDIIKLVNLRLLDVYGCENMSYMPAGMGKLTCLQTVPMFILFGDDGLKQYKKAKLIDLKVLINNLRGHLYVIHYGMSDDEPFDEHMDVQLESLKLKCVLEAHHKEGQEALLETMFFDHEFRKMKVHNYVGTKLPSLASGLVSINLVFCDKLQYLPSSLCQLCHLKFLQLECLNNVEYIESDAPSPSAKFFPSLEKLKLYGMPRLEGWWRDIRWMEKEAFFIPSFPKLCELIIQECERLTYFPPCPLVIQLYINKVSEALTFCMKNGDVQNNPFCLKRLSIDNSCIFNSLGRKFVGSDVFIDLYDIENVGPIREGFQSCASCIRELQIRDCWEMEKMGMEHLTNLRSLTLVINLEGIPWRSLGSLSYLEIIDFRAKILPMGIQYLTSLQSSFLDSCMNLEDFGDCVNSSLKSLQRLTIYSCFKLKSLPEEMRQLTSLTAIYICDCPELKSLPEDIRHLTYFDGQGLARKEITA